MSEAIIFILVFLIWIVCCFAVLVAIGLYILRAVAFQKLLRKYNYRKSWMAWIPYAQYYALADAAAEGSPTMKLFSADCPVWWFKFWYIITNVAAYLPFVGPVAIFIFKMFFLGSVYRTIYARVEGRTLGSRTALGFFSAIIGLIPIIKFLHYDSSKIAGCEEKKPAEEAVPVPLIEAVKAPAQEAPVSEAQAPAAPVQAAPVSEAQAPEAPEATGNAAPEEEKSEE